MITEAVILIVKPDLTDQFENDFKTASKYISIIKGYQKHSLKRCIEVDNKYLLTVYWDTLEDHTVGFRTSNEYQEWKKLLHHYYDPFPVVEHFTTVL